LEHGLNRQSIAGLASILAEQHIDARVLEAAFAIKKIASQINVTIHVLGIILSLPKILEPGEVIESVSLGAGNTGRKFDLETDRRIAEFKFISWKGGAEAVRQNQLFKDFYLLAEADSVKRKELYVTGALHPERFFASGRSIQSILSRNNRLWELFQAQHGERFSYVKEYIDFRRQEVRIIDLSELLPELFGSQLAIETLARFEVDEI
jgi:hypothetical protein